MIKLGNPYLDRKYEVLKLINRGGMGSEIYLAIDRTLNKQWAIKKVQKTRNTEQTRQMMEEAKIMTTFEHPNLPRVVDIVDESSCFYVIMDYIQGENLKTVLKTEGPQDQELVVQWGIILADVLRYMHEHGLIYRDMKPANVMLTPEGKLYLIDFGAVKRTSIPETRATRAIGTAGFAPPEQCSLDGPGADERSDIYSLGATLFQLLTDISPAKWLNEGHKTFDPREADPTISSGLQTIILKCTEKSPEDRIQTADKLKSYLANYKKFDSKYIERRKRVLRKFIVLVASSLVLILAGSLVYAAGSIKISSKYESLLSGTPSRANIMKAIKLKPDGADGYEALLSSYGDQITAKEQTDFASVYGDGKAEMDRQARAQVATDAGERILASYEEDSERARLIVAKPYFEEAVFSGGKHFSRYTAAKTYADMAVYYQKYIMKKSSLSAQESSKSDLEALISEMGTSVSDLDKYKGSDKISLTMSAGSLISGLVYEEADVMADRGVQKSQLTYLLGKVQRSIENLNPSEQILKDRKTILLSNISDTETKIDQAYN
jgi:serine/threonine protein kinase